MRWLLLTLCACGSPAQPAPDAALALPPDVSAIDIVVSPTRIVLYIDFGDQNVTNPPFASPGACGAFGDTHTSERSRCLGTSSVDDHPLTSTLGDNLNPFVLDYAVTPTSSLGVEDCGHTITVPLPVMQFPHAASASGVRSGDTDMIATWTQDPTPSTLVTASTINADLYCDDIGTTEHRFAVYSPNNAIHGRVQPLLAPVVTQTELGTVRVWYGDITTFDVP